jgi:hypothetical protein
LGQSTLRFEKDVIFLQVMLEGLTLFPADAARTGGDGSTSDTTAQLCILFSRGSAVKTIVSSFFFGKM